MSPATLNMQIAGSGYEFFCSMQATEAVKTRLHRKHVPIASPPRTAGEARARAQQASKRAQSGLIYPDGVYAGETENGKRSGFGVMIYYNGHSKNRYEGGWKDDKMHGWGVETSAAGACYEGEQKAGKAHGLGVFIGADGFRHDGGFKDDKRDGHQH